MKNIIPILKSLGLQDSEIKTYYAALGQGPSTVIELAKKSGLSRQAVYLALDALSTRGLMSSVLRGKKNYYAAEMPDRLLAYAKRREAELKVQIDDLAHAIPEIELQLGGERPVVRLFEGKEGLKAFLADIESVKPAEIYELTDLNAMYTILKADDFTAVRKELTKNKTILHGIYSGTPSPQPIEKSERYYIEDDFRNFKANIDVYDNKTAFGTFEGKMNSVVIENAAIANAMRALFELALREMRRENGK